MVFMQKCATSNVHEISKTKHSKAMTIMMKSWKYRAKAKANSNIKFLTIKHIKVHYIIFSGVAIIAYKSLHFSVEKKNVLNISLIINANQLMWTYFKNASSHTNSRDYSTPCMYACHWAREAVAVQILQIQVKSHDLGQTRTALKGHPLQQLLLG